MLVEGPETSSEMLDPRSLRFSAFWNLDGLSGPKQGLTLSPSTGQRPGAESPKKIGLRPAQVMAAKEADEEIMLPN